MRHRVSGRKLGRGKDERKALFRNLVGELIVHGRAKTTAAKAKAVRPLVDKLVTKAKQGTLGGRRDIFGMLPKDTAVAFLNTIVPRFANRASGFSRIIHLGPRSGDHAEMVILEWVEQVEIKNEKVKSKNEKEETKEKKTTTPRKRKVSKKA